MKDFTIESLSWATETIPLGASIWTKIAGRLTGHGKHSYSNLRSYFSLHIVTRGQGWVKTKYGTWPLKAGDMFIKWPGIWIQYWENPLHPWTYFWTHLTGPGTPDFVRACGFATEHPVLRPLKPNVVANRMQRILAAYRRQRPEDEARILAWMYEIVPACARQKQLKPHPMKARYQELVEQASTILHPHHAPVTNINQLADMMKVSRITLFRAFREILGITPRAYFSGLRIQKAMFLLNDSSRSLSSVAHASGYSDTKHLQRCFKKATGETPTTFRQHK